MVGSAALTGAHLPVAYLALASIGAFVVYRVDRLLVDSEEDAVNVPERVYFRDAHRRALTYALLFAIPLTLVAVWALEPAWMLAAAFLGAAGISYPLRFLPGRRRPKDIAWLKTALIAFCWVTGGVVLPLLLIDDGRASSSLWSIQGIAAIALYRTLYILPNLITADWMDREGDQASGLHSLGGRLSSIGVRWVAVVSMCLALALTLLLIAWGVPWWLIMIDAGGLLGLTVSVWRVTGHGSGRIVLMDMWAGYPVVTWLFSLIVLGI